jgi:glycosyltransferase involved in cell wall biosynthesis
MKVLLVSSGSGSRGGGEIFLDYVGKELSDRGHEVLIWMPNHVRMDELAERCSRFARIIRADYRNTYDYAGRSLWTAFNWRVSDRIAREWKALRPDVIHINKQNLEDGLDLLRAARVSNLPCVCTIHLTQSARYLRARAALLRDWIARWELRRFPGAFITVQEGRRVELSEFLGGQACTQTVFNGVPNVDRLRIQHLRTTKRSELGLSDGDHLVLGVGRLTQQKRPLLFVRVAQELHRRLPTARFIWVGDGDLAEEWRRAILEERLDHVIHCVGWQADVLPYLVAADLMLHVAQFEGLPFAVIEAMAAQVPCAISKELASEIPFFNSSNTLFIDDVDDLAQSLRNPHALAEVAAGGHDLIESLLSVRKMAESYEQLYLDAKKVNAEGGAAKKHSYGR